MLQPYELVRLKRRPIGLAIHTLIHAAVMAAFAAPFLPRWWLVIPGVAVVHYLIDWMKVEKGEDRGPRSLVAFLFDQGVHMSILVLAVGLAGLSLRAEVSYGPPQLTAILYYAIPYVAVTFGGAILLYQIAVAFDTRANPADLLILRLRLAGMLERTLALSIVLFLHPVWWWVGALSSLVQVGANHRQRGRWVESVSSLAFVVALGLLFR